MGFVSRLACPMWRIVVQQSRNLVKTRNTETSTIAL
jgi:hypothetical protein